MVYEKIAEYLKSHGVKQSYLVKSTSFSSQALTAAIKGKRKISVEEYLELCHALHVPVDYFAA